MIVKVLTLEFLFLIRLRFPSKKSIAEIICKRYGSDKVKQLQRFEKLDYKVCKNQGDLEFLKLCQENGLTPKLLNFKTNLPTPIFVVQIHIISVSLCY